eukprot:TRINITY_DN9261_c0_g1_i1.p1 TRINITY_DN9261_c0_g1~~TRINITY_DN9261_c0_g1_i1.p1  ORF type:complete len:276 (+),score=65.47 TRINITY_DN9261_c0_g1_i1:68-895(+)
MASVRSLAFVTFCAVGTMVMSEDELQSRQQDLQSENVLRAKLKQAQEKAASSKRHIDPTAHMRANLGKVYNQKRTVHELGAEPKEQTFINDELHPAARELRKKFDQENDYIVKNGITFTREMKEQRKKELDDVMKLIAAEMRQRAYEEGKKAYAEKKASQRRPQSGDDSWQAGFDAGNGEPTNDNGNNRQPNVEMRKIRSQAYDENVSNAQGVENLRRQLNKQARGNISDKELEEIHQRLQLGLDKKRREEHERLTRERHVPEKAASPKKKQRGA